MPLCKVFKLEQVQDSYIYSICDQNIYRVYLLCVGVLPIVSPVPYWRVLSNACIVLKTSGVFSLEEREIYSKLEVENIPPKRIVYILWPEI